MPFSSYIQDFAITTGLRFSYVATESRSYSFLTWAGSEVGWTSMGATRYGNSSGNDTAAGYTGGAFALFPGTGGSTSTGFGKKRFSTGSYKIPAFLQQDSASYYAYGHNSAMTSYAVETLSKAPWAKYKQTIQYGASYYPWPFPGFSEEPTINNSSDTFEGALGEFSPGGAILKYKTMPYTKTYIGVAATAGTQVFLGGVAPSTVTRQFTGDFTTVVPYDFSLLDNQVNVTSTIAFSWLRNTNGTERFSAENPILVIVSGAGPKDSLTLGQGQNGAKSVSACGKITAQTGAPQTSAASTTGWTWNEASANPVAVIETVVFKSTYGSVGCLRTQTLQVQKYEYNTYTTSATTNVGLNKGSVPSKVYYSYENTRLHLTTRSSSAIAGTRTYIKTYLARTTSAHVDFASQNETTLATYTASDRASGATKTFFPVTINGGLGEFNPAIGTFSPRVAYFDPPYYINQQVGFENFFSQEALTGNFVYHVNDRVAYRGIHGAGALYTFSALANRLPGSPTFFDFGNCSGAFPNDPFDTGTGISPVTIVQLATKSGASTLISQSVRKITSSTTRSFFVYYDNSTGTFSSGMDPAVDKSSGGSRLGPRVPLVASHVYNIIGRAGSASYKADENYFKSNELSFASVQGVYSHPISLELNYTDSHLASSSVFRADGSYYSTVKNLMMQTYY